MDALEHLRQTLEYYRQQRQKKLEDYRAADSLVRQLERELGETPSSDGDAVILTNGFTETLIGTPRSLEVRPDEFFGMSQSDAAKAYLRKVKKAISFDQLVEALRNGGAQLGGADPKRTLYVSLARNPLKEFVNPKEGYIGLREFYPGLAKMSTPREPRKTKKPKKGKAKQKRMSVKSRKTKSIVGKRVHKIMNDGHPHSSDEIVKAVESQLGTIKKIEVFGALRSKEFVKEEDGRYRMRN